MAFFEGLVVTEEGAPVTVGYVGTEAFYIVDDQGFKRHIEARPIDRAVLRQFADQLAEHRDEAAEAMLKLLGQDDLFTKAMVESTLDHIDLEKTLDHGLPPDARQWLGLLGFRVVINVHGELVRIEMPALPEGYEEE